MAPPPALTLRGEEVNMVADGLLHGALKGPVRGGDGQEEEFGGGVALREEPLLLPVSAHLPRLLLLLLPSPRSARLLLS